MILPLVTGVFPLIGGMVYLLSLLFGFQFTWTLVLKVWISLVLAGILVFILIHREEGR